jgi:hypothetical protein
MIKKEDSSSFINKKVISEIEESITIWDLPQQARRTQVFEATKHLGRIKHIEMIKEGHHKLRAEITLTREKYTKQEETPWVIPFQKELLVRITPGNNRREILESRKLHMIKLYRIPKNVNEVLLFRQIRHTNAKAVHIFKNTNGNNKGFAIVSFKNKKDLEQAKKFSIAYYNNKLSWEKERNDEFNSITQMNSFIQRPVVRTWKTDTEEESDTNENESFITRDSEQEVQEISAYTKKKRMEIQEGKRKESSKSQLNRVYKIQEQETKSRNSRESMLQFLKDIEEKIYNMEWEAPYRS